MYEETEPNYRVFKLAKLNGKNRIFLPYLEIKTRIFMYLNGCAEIARCDCELKYIALHPVLEISNCPLAPHGLILLGAS